MPICPWNKWLHKLWSENQKYFKRINVFGLGPVDGPAELTEQSTDFALTSTKELVHYDRPTDRAAKASIFCLGISVDRMVARYPQRLEIWPLTVDRPVDRQTD